MPVVSPESRTIEIVGVAGSGKSTLSKVLTGRYPSCQLADSLHTRLPAHWPYVAGAAPRVLPLLGAALRAGRPVPSWEEVKFALYLSGWSRYLREKHPSGVVLLDQGPLFAIARLLWGDKPVTRDPRFRGWMEAMAMHWSAELDAVVWLTAPDAVLVQRIDHRPQGHEAKGQPAERALRLVESHRRAYGHVLGVIESIGRPPVRHYDTSTASPSAIADDLGELFESEGRHAVDGSAAGGQPASEGASAHGHV